MANTRLQKKVSLDIENVLHVNELMTITDNDNFSDVLNLALSAYFGNDESRKTIEAFRLLHSVKD